MVQKGRSVVFECKVKHDLSLTPNATWLKDDEELPDDRRSELFAEVSQFNGSSQYLISNLKLYCCVYWCMFVSISSIMWLSFPGLDATPRIDTIRCSAKLSV